MPKFVTLFRADLIEPQEELYTMQCRRHPSYRDQRVSCARRFTHPRRIMPAYALFIVGFAASGCEKKTTSATREPAVIRLIDSFRPESIEGRTAASATLPRTEWRFDAPPEEDATKDAPLAFNFDKGPDVSDLRVEDGKLMGRTTGHLPMIRFSRTIANGNADPLHAVEVRYSISAGTLLRATFESEAEVDFAKAAQRVNTYPDDYSMTAPIVADGAMHTCTLRPPFSLHASDLRHLILLPADVADANFAIESVRVIFRNEYVASLASKIGWHGLAEIYHETIITKSPDVFRLSAQLGSRPWLDLAIGTVDDGPVTFRIRVSSQGAGELVLLERTLTRPHRWESERLDLTAFAGRSVNLDFELLAEHEGALGYWGSLIVRNDGANPVRETAAALRQDAPQGVILIWADTLRRDHLSAYGYHRNTSPHLDQMAAEGALFDDCILQATWTKVSTPSLMTGLYPTSHGVHEFSDRLPSSAVTLAEKFRDAGYATLSLSSILFTGKFTNLHQGFDVVHESNSLPNRDSSKTAREYVDRLLPWLKIHREVPFFVFLHVSDPHDPYEPYRPYDTMWADPSKKRQHVAEAQQVRELIQDPLMKQFGMATREELQRAGIDPEAYIAMDRDWYDGSIRAMDAEIGRLFEALRELDLDDRTLVIFTADHGEEFLEHGRMFHGQSTYGELSRAPLVMRWPGVIPAGKVMSETVANIDLYPTLLECCGLTSHDQVQGKSLVAFLNGSSAQWSRRPVVTEKAATTESKSPAPRTTESYAIAWDGWKLIHNVQRPEGHPEFELYNYRDDPAEQVNLVSSHADRASRFQLELSQWRQQAEATQLQSDEELANELSPDELARLRSLGYIGK